MLLARLESMLNIRPGEWRETGFFWFFTFMCWFSLALGDSISDTLFIKRAGVENLPLMFIFCSLAAIPVSLLLAVLQGRVAKRKLTAGAGLASAVAVFAAVHYISNSDSGSVVGCYVLYFVTNLLVFVVPVILSVLLGTQFNALKAKRLVPIVFTGVIAGRVVAGGTLSYLALRYPVPSILWFWAVMHALAFVFFFIGSSSYVKPQIQSFFQRPGEQKQTRFFDRLRNFVRTLTESQLVLFLVISAVMANFSFYFAEFQSASILNAHFASENDLALFYGWFTIGASLLAFLFQAFITGGLIHRLGISNTNVIYPILALTAFLGTTFSYTLVPGVWLKFVQIGLLTALFQPVSNLFYNALPPREKARIITVSEGVVQPLGTVVTGLLLYHAGTSTDLIRFFPLAAAAVWIAVTVLMRKPYRDSLLKLLRSSSLDFFNKGDLQKLNLDRNTFNLMLGHLDSADEEASVLIVQLIVSNCDRGSREQMMRKLSGFSEERKEELLRQVVLPVDHFTAEFLFACLDSSNLELQYQALKAISIFPSSPRLRQRVTTFIASDSERLRCIASAILVRIGDLDQMMRSLEIIQGFISTSDHASILKGIEIIGYTGDERFWVNLRPFFASADVKIRLAAAQAFEKILSNGETDEHYEIIGRLIKDDLREIRYLALKMLARLTEPKWFYHVIEGLSDSSPRNRKYAEEILIAHYNDKFSDLIMVLESSEATLYAKAAVGGILAASQDGSVRDYLHQFGKRVIQQLYEYKLEEYVITRDTASESSVYLRMLLRERAWSLTRLIVCLIAPEQNREARDLFKSLYSSNDELVSNAVEVLQNMGERQLVYHIIPVLENISLDNVVSYAMKAFSMREKDLRIILGKYLNSSDSELKEAAIHTVCMSEIRDLIPVLKKIEADTSASASVLSTCRWATESLKARGITMQYQ
jgi:HEAT repeat protein/MFS family permease